MPSPLNERYCSTILDKTGDSYRPGECKDSYCREFRLAFANDDHAAGGKGPSTSQMRRLLQKPSVPSLRPTQSFRVDHQGAQFVGSITTLAVRKQEADKRLASKIDSFVLKEALLAIQIL